MEFEWDVAKATINLKKHGIDFIDAAKIFDGEMLVELDRRNDYGERRYNALGTVDGHVLRVVFTIRKDTVRLISAWKASRNDKRKLGSLHHGRTP